MKRITKEEYDAARQTCDEANKIMQEYHRQSMGDFESRWKRFESSQQFFTDEELRYSAGARCWCGAGLAYPKDCGINHQWTCSAVLKGEGKEKDRPDKRHEAYPFAFYEIKSEDQPSAEGHTTRPISIAPPMCQGGQIMS